MPVSLSCRYRCLEVITTPVPHPSDNIKTWLADETHHEVMSLSFFSHYIDMHGITCNQNGTTLHLEQQVIKKKRGEEGKVCITFIMKAEESRELVEVIGQ